MVRGPLQHLSQHSPHSRHRNSCCCSDNKDEPVGLFVGALLMAFSNFNAKFNETTTNLFKQNLKLVGSWHQQPHSPFSCYFLADNSPAAYDKTRSLSATQAAK